MRKLWPDHFASEPSPWPTATPGARHPFSSFFSSMNERQSVPWAMILLGLFLIIRASGRRMRHPVDILVHIQPNVRHDAREEDVLTRAERLDADRLPFEVAHGADALRPEQHEAASVDARQQDDRVASVYLDDTGRHEVE